MQIINLRNSLGLNVLLLIIIIILLLRCNHECPPCGDGVVINQSQVVNKRQDSSYISWQPFNGKDSLWFTDGGKLIGTITSVDDSTIMFTGPSNWGHTAGGKPGKPHIKLDPDYTKPSIGTGEAIGGHFFWDGQLKDDSTIIVQRRGNTERRINVDSCLNYYNTYAFHDSVKHKLGWIHLFDTLRTNRFVGRGMRTDFTYYDTTRTVTVRENPKVKFYYGVGGLLFKQPLGPFIGKAGGIDLSLQAKNQQLYNISIYKNVGPGYYVRLATQFH